MERPGRFLQVNVLPFNYWSYEHLYPPSSLTPKTRKAVNLRLEALDSNLDSALCGLLHLLNVPKPQFPICKKQASSHYPRNRHKVTKVKATNIGVAKLNSHNNLVRFQLESKPLHLLTLHELGFTGASCTHGHLLTLDHKLTNTIHSPPSLF